MLFCLCTCNCLSVVRIGHQPLAVAFMRPCWAARRNVLRKHHRNLKLVLAIINSNIYQLENHTDRHQPRQDGFHDDDEAERADTAGVYIRIRPHGTPSAAHRGLCRQGAHMRDV